MLGSPLLKKYFNKMPLFINLCRFYSLGQCVQTQFNIGFFLHGSLQGQLCWAEIFVLLQFFQQLLLFPVFSIQNQVKCDETAQQQAESP